MKIEYLTSATCTLLDDVPKGATITAVKGLNCIGMCEDCGLPILENESYKTDSDGVFWHKGECSTTEMPSECGHYWFACAESDNKWLQATIFRQNGELFVRDSDGVELLDNYHHNLIDLKWRKIP